MSQKLALFVALALGVIGSIGPVTAQTHSTQSSTTTSTGGGSEGGRLVRYGTPGNCPPTVACSDETRRPPTAATPSSCDRWEWRTGSDGLRVRKCLER